MDIDKVYDMIYFNNDSNPPVPTTDEYEALKNLKDSISFLKKEQPDLYNDIQIKLQIYSDVERRIAFKMGFKTAAELVMSIEK
ncbi:MAG: hypothetical protein NC122_02565 [Faecalibacterium sp.]|nr:hypothetical protein [Ruminococcus sp.]MCM1391974.1 hypothetical protein [Ruminococcus sp.]MCM1485067.1 hypothetical protein [Faecalibacterium sp.]